MQGVSHLYLCNEDNSLQKQYPNLAYINDKRVVRLLVRFTVFSTVFRIQISL